MAQPDWTEQIGVQTEAGDRFCLKCQAVTSTQAGWKDKKVQIRHHETLREFQKAVAAECALCVRVLAAIKSSRGNVELIEALSDGTEIDDLLPVTVDAFAGSSYQVWQISPL